MQKLNKTEIPATGWIAINVDDEVVMMAQTPNGPVFLFTDQNIAVFVPFIEIAGRAGEFAKKPDTVLKTIKEPTKH